MSETCSVCGEKKGKARMSRSTAIVCLDCYPDYAIRSRREYQRENYQKLKPYHQEYNKIHAEKINAQHKVKRAEKKKQAAEKNENVYRVQQ